MNDDIIRIAKRDTARGEDGYKTFSVRIKEDTVAALDDLAPVSYTHLDVYKRQL